VEDDLEPVREAFRSAGRPFLRSPWSWFCWAALLPAAALASPIVSASRGPAGVLFLWSTTILAGGAAELLALRRGGVRLGGATPLASWVLRLQGNLSIIAVALSLLLLWLDQAWAIPGVWMLVVGHSFYLLGGFAFGPFRVAGLLLQGGGVLALWPQVRPLAVFALTSALANLWIGIGVWRENRVRV
jgi:hypothetical protein